MSDADGKAITRQMSKLKFVAMAALCYNANDGQIEFLKATVRFVLNRYPLPGYRLRILESRIAKIHTAPTNGFGKDGNRRIGAHPALLNQQVSVLADTCERIQRYLLHLKIFQVCFYRSTGSR